MRFSVVIPAHNEAANVEAAVRALHAQTVPPGDVEIIVVDNASTDTTADRARLAGADRVVSEPHQGTNIARQRGFTESTGAIVAFLDADCVPPPGWLLHIERDLALPGVAAVSGPYDYGFTGVKRALDRLVGRTLFAHAGALFHFLFRKKDGILRGGNFAARRETIERIGGLPPLTFWGDDTAIGILIARRVGDVFYDTKLVVKSSPRRFEKRGLVRLTLKYFYYHFKIYFSKDY